MPASAACSSAARSASWREHDHRRLRGDRRRAASASARPSVPGGSISRSTSDDVVRVRGRSAARAALGRRHVLDSALGRAAARARARGAASSAETARTRSGSGRAAVMRPGGQLGRLEPVGREDLHQPHEREERDRLDDVGVRARLVGGRDRRGVVVGAERDDRDPARARVALERADQRRGRRACRAGPRRSRSARRGRDRAVRRPARSRYASTSVAIGDRPQIGRVAAFEQRVPRHRPVVLVRIREQDRRQHRHPRPLEAIAHARPPRSRGRRTIRGHRIKHLLLVLRPRGFLAPKVCGRRR